MQLCHTALRCGRLSSFLSGEMKMSTGLINKLKWGDAIRVNDMAQHTDYPVQIGDVITVRLDEPPAQYPAQDAPLQILYEDAHILVVDKPAGMLIHPSHCKNTDTLANYVLGYYHRTGQDSAFHPITRLDRDTFGIVLLAKNSHIHTLLQQQPLKKVYHALVLGGPADPSGQICAPIARRPLPSLLRYIHPSGKESVTSFRVLSRSAGVCKLELLPITGRTHQLRLHCAHMGYPILGDPQYGNEACMRYGWQSQALCAYSLEFDHPITGNHLLLTSGMDV